MNRYLKLSIILACILTSCRKPVTHIDFYYLIDSDKNAIENVLKNSLSPYIYHNQTILPSYNSKLFVISGGKIIGRNLFKQSALQKFMNFELDERKLKLLSNKIDLTLLLKDIKNIKEINKHDYTTFLHSRSKEVIFSRYVVDKRNINLKNKIQNSINDIKELKSNQVIVVGIPTMENPYYEENNPKISIKTPNENNKTISSIGYGIVTTGYGDLHVRKEPGLSGKILFEIPNGSKTTVLHIGPEDWVDRKRDNWVKIKYENNVGWVWGYYLDVHLY